MEGVLDSAGTGNASGWWVSLAYKELNAGLLIGSTHQLKNAGADQ